MCAQDRVLLITRLSGIFRSEERLLPLGEVLRENGSRLNIRMPRVEKVGYMLRT